MVSRSTPFIPAPRGAGQQERITTITTPINTLMRDTYALATDEGRKPGTRGHRKARRFLHSRFTELGLNPKWQHFRLHVPKRPMLRGHNLIGTIPGRDRSLAPILIGAHYDSVIMAPCADDNAAAVAIMLSVAERFEPGQLERDLIVVAFDTEEPPYFHSPLMGSTRFVQDYLHRPVHVAIIMDLVGHAVGLGDPDMMVVTGIESHPELVNVATNLDLPTIAVRNDRVGDMSDHHAFRLAGMPFLFLSCGEWQHYHQTSDRPELLDYAKMERVADDLWVMVQRADRVDMDGAEPHDISALEQETMFQHAGALLEKFNVTTVGQAVHVLRTAMHHV